MYVPINSLGYSCIKKLQRDNLWHAYNEAINFYSADFSIKYSTRAIITRGLYIFYPLFEGQKRFFKGLFS